MTELFKCPKCKQSLTIDHYKNRSKTCDKCYLKEPVTAPNIDHLGKFDPNQLNEKLSVSVDDANIRNGLSMLLFGSSKSGKTYMLRHLIEHLADDFEIIILFTINPRNELLRGLVDMFPSKFIIFDEFQPELVKMLFDINRALDPSKMVSILFLLDDIIDQKQSRILNNMLITYRNANISTILCSQSYSIVSKNARANCHYIMAGKFYNIASRYDIISIYLHGHRGFCPCIDEIPRRHLKGHEQLLYEAATDDYNFIVINNLENTIHRYRA